MKISDLLKLVSLPMNKIYCDTLCATNHSDTVWFQKISIPPPPPPTHRVTRNSKGEGVWSYQKIYFRKLQLNGLIATPYAYIYIGCNSLMRWNFKLQGILHFRQNFLLVFYGALHVKNQPGLGTFPFDLIFITLQRFNAFASVNTRKCWRKE